MINTIITINHDNYTENVIVTAANVAEVIKMVKGMDWAYVVKGAVMVVDAKIAKKGDAVYAKYLASVERENEAVVNEYDTSWDGENYDKYDNAMWTKAIETEQNVQAKIIAKASEAVTAYIVENFDAQGWS